MATINGTAKADTITGTQAPEQIFGLGGGDTINGGGGLDDVFGGAGNDRLNTDGPAVVDFNGGAGKDTVAYFGLSSTDTIISLARGIGISGLAAGDTYVSIENVNGGPGIDQLFGSAVANILSGGLGNDLLNGMGGRDQLFGNAGRDEFEFSSLADSGVGAGKRDLIGDFSRAEGDRIHLASFDADPDTAGFQFFDFIGKAGFTEAGQVRFLAEGGDTVVEVNSKGSSTPEMQIELDGRIELTSADFILLV